MMVSSVASSRDSSAVMRPSWMTRMRSLADRISGSSDEIMTMATPCAASSPISAWISAFAPTSTPRVGSSRKRTRGVAAVQRPMTTFCWFPPGQRRHRPLGVWRAQGEALDHAADGRHLHPPRDPADPRKVGEDAHHGVAAHGQPEHQAISLAILGHVAHVRLDRVTRAADADGLAIDADLAGVVRVEPEDGARHLRAAARPPGLPAPGSPPRAPRTRRRGRRRCGRSR